MTLCSLNKNQFDDDNLFCTILSKFNQLLDLSNACGNNNYNKIIIKAHFINDPQIEKQLTNLIDFSLKYHNILKMSKQLTDNMKSTILNFNTSNHR